MTVPIGSFRDDFEDNLIAPVWHSYTSGSATIAEVSGQFRATLPASTAGTHTAGYQTLASFDLTGDGAYININTMVSTAVAAVTTFQVILDGSNLVQWYQQSNTINVQKVVAGVATGLYSAAWSGTTYKYLRIRESGGTIFFDSSTNGTVWTNRASIVGLPFAITAIAINIGASCGNVASPGSFRVDDFNLILPALATNWHYTQVEWPLLYRFRVITIAATSGQGYMATSNDGTTWAYYSGPMGSSSGGYNALTLQSTQAAAQAMAVNLPSDGRWDLPSIVECRYIRLYHRSITGSSYTLREYYPRRLVQSDDMEAESIQAINIAAGAITADKIFVLTLGAITANIGQLVIDTTGYLWQGTGTAASPTTGLKIFNSGGVGKLSTYNTGVEQVTLDTDGKLKAGAGNVQLSEDGIYIIAGTSNLYNAQRSYGFIDTVGGARVADIYDLEGPSAHSLNVKLFSKASRDSQLLIDAAAPTSQVSFVRLTAQVNSVIGAQLTVQAGGGSPGVNVTTGDFNVSNGTNLGLATGATSGDLFGDGELKMTGNGTHILQGDLRLENSASTARYLRFYNANGSNETLIRDNGGAGVASLQIRPGGTTNVTIESAKLGFMGTAAITKPTVTGSRGGNAALQSVLTALANYGLIVDSSS